MKENNDEHSIWDGTEAEIIEDSQSSEFESDNIGIKLSYTLTQNEIFDAVYYGNLFRVNSKKKDRIYIITFLVLLCGFLGFYIYNRNITNIFMAVFCVISILGILIIPKLYVKSFAKNMANNNDKELKVSIFSDRLDIGSDEGKWHIDFNDDCQVQEINNLFVITSKEKSCIIPHRAIEPDLLAEVSAIMLSVGMKNNEDEF